MGGYVRCCGSVTPLCLGIIDLLHLKLEGNVQVGFDGAMAKLSAIMLVGTGFASLNQTQLLKDTRYMSTT